MKTKIFDRTIRLEHCDLLAISSQLVWLLCQNIFWVVCPFFSLFYCCGQYGEVQLAGCKDVWTDVMAFGAYELLLAWCDRDPLFFFFLAKNQLENCFKVVHFDPVEKSLYRGVIFRMLKALTDTLSCCAIFNACQWAPFIFPLLLKWGMQLLWHKWQSLKNHTVSRHLTS